MPAQKQLRIVTFNVGGGREEFESTAANILDTIRLLAPDVLAIQESTEWTEASGHTFNFCHEVEKTLKLGHQGYFGKTLSLRENFHPKKTTMLNGLYLDWQDWMFGNALLSRLPYTLLGNPNVPGSPQNLPIFKPLIYEGNRDTDPRSAVLARINTGERAPYLVCTHLTTLAGERGSVNQIVPGKYEKAQALRFIQTQMLLALLKPIIAAGELIILMGDFNAGPQEACIQALIDSGFMRLEPRKEIPTHPKAAQPVDHLFVYPSGALSHYDCWIEESTVTRTASDHLPVVADIIFA